MKEERKGERNKGKRKVINGNVMKKYWKKREKTSNARMTIMAEVLE